MSSLLTILAYLREKKVIHGDLKPQNIILDSFGFPHLVDFGTAAFFKQKNAHQNGGSLPYMAPEVVLGITHSYSIDYYALGVIAFELFLGRLPFNASSESELKKEIKKTEVNCQTYFENKVMSKDASDFITKLLVKNKDKRMGHKSIAEVFEHPWIKSFDRGRFIRQGKNQIFKDLNQRQAERSYISSKSSETPQEYVSILNQDYVQQMFKILQMPPGESTLTNERSFSMTSTSLVSEKAKVQRV